jgi:hypothetical protein
MVHNIPSLSFPRMSKECEFKERFRTEPIKNKKGSVTPLCGPGDYPIRISPEPNIEPIVLYGSLSDMAHFDPRVENKFAQPKSCTYIRNLEVA